MKYDFTTLTNSAVNQTLFPKSSIEEAFKNLNFIQADPIKAPASAQDLILRHRVDGYRVGDLERAYPDLKIDEDYLYAYGFITEYLRKFLHPRVSGKINKFDKQVLDEVKKAGELHPRQLESIFGKKIVRNGWGGKSRATKRSLEHLHHNGLLRVSRREKGIRIYRSADQEIGKDSLQERKKQIVMILVKILAPVASKTLSQSLLYVRYFLGETRSAVNELIKEGLLMEKKIDGVNYIWSADMQFSKESHEGVKILTPFDPIVWDRIRFEHLWGWQYRFEAYTPKEKRVRGYYAMPILWNSKVIGWANVKKLKTGIDLELGFIDGRPTDTQFKKGIQQEAAELEEFLSKKLK